MFYCKRKNKMQNVKPITERNYGLDLVRALAISFVILIHAIGFSPAGYMSVIDGPFDFIRIFIQRICYTCVPLFVILSGYLNKQKEDPMFMYKKSGPRLIITYFFWEIIITLLNIICWGESFSKYTITKLFSYSVDSGRSWYMNMYFGLFLLMPFLNRGWNILGKVEKKCVLVILFLLSFASKYIQMLSSMYFAGDGQIVLVSDYYYGCAFIFYYLVGAYIADYHVQMKKRNCLVALLLVLTVHTAYYFIMGYGGVFNDIPNATSFWYDNPILAVEAIMLFILMYDFKGTESRINHMVENISKQSFDMYLCSFIFDMIIYHKLFKIYDRIPILLGIFICAFLSFVISYFAADLKNRVFRVVRYILSKK